MRAKELAMLLSKFKDYRKRRVDLEQYTIPSDLAAKILKLAELRGDITGRVVFDLGCGTGRLGIGAALLGASKVLCVDVDPEAIEVAKENLAIAEEAVGKKLPVEFLVSNVAELHSLKCDTVVQNPPFGIRSEQLDLLFLKVAISIAKVVYSLHRGPEARRFLKKYIQDLGAKVLEIHPFKFTIPYSFWFHRKPKVEVEVDLYIISANNKHEV